MESQSCFVFTPQLQRVTSGLFRDHAWLVPSWFHHGGFHKTWINSPKCSEKQFYSAIMFLVYSDITNVCLQIRLYRRPFQAANTFLQNTVLFIYFSFSRVKGHRYKVLQTKSVIDWKDWLILCKINKTCCWKKLTERIVFLIFLKGGAHNTIVDIFLQWVNDQHSECVQVLKG